MTPKDVSKNLYELRLTQLETSLDIIELLKTVMTKSLWKELGHDSFIGFCKAELGYGTDELRSVLIELGVIVPTSRLVSEDPAIQKRIDALRQWRTDRAAILKWPSYRVIGNRTLFAIAERNPESTDELSKISGIGVTKLRRFGHEILAVLGNRSSGLRPSSAAF